MKNSTFRDTVAEINELKRSLKRINDLESKKYVQSEIDKLERRISRRKKKKTKVDTRSIEDRLKAAERAYQNEINPEMKEMYKNLIKKLKSS